MDGKIHNFFYVDTNHMFLDVSFSFNVIRQCIVFNSIGGWNMQNQLEFQLTSKSHVYWNPMKLSQILFYLCLFLSLYDFCVVVFISLFCGRILHKVAAHKTVCVCASLYESNRAFIRCRARTNRIRLCYGAMKWRAVWPLTHTYTSKHRNEHKETDHGYVICSIFICAQYKPVIRAKRIA